MAARGCAFKGENVWLLRTRWGIPTVKINGVGANPLRWPNGSFSIQGVAAKLGITPQTVFHYLARGLLAGHQLTKGQPWQIDLSDEQINRLRARPRYHESFGSPITSCWFSRLFRRLYLQKLVGPAELPGLAVAPQIGRDDHLYRAWFYAQTLQRSLLPQRRFGDDIVLFQELDLIGRQER